MTAKDEQQQFPIDTSSKLLLSSALITQSSKIVHITPKPVLRSYHLPKSFTSRVGINPLTTAAAPLFVLMGKLNQTLTYSNDIKQLQANLISEIKSFETKALDAHYPEEQILLGRYILCVALDESIKDSPWGKSWHGYSLIYAFFKSDYVNGSIINLLNKLRSNSDSFLDLLEFSYLCFSLVLGKSALKQEQHDIEQMLDDFYQIIRRKRNHKKQTKSQNNKLAQKIIPIKLLPFKRIIFFSILTLVIIYCTLIAALHFEIKPIEQLLNLININ